MRKCWENAEVGLCRMPWFDSSDAVIQIMSSMIQRKTSASLRKPATDCKNVIHSNVCQWNRVIVTGYNSFGVVLKMQCISKAQILLLPQRIILGKQAASPGLPDWPFHGQFRKIWPYLNCAGHEKTHLAILQNLANFLAIFVVCHCKIKFSLNIFFFVFFGRCSRHSFYCSNIIALQPFIALKCVEMI